MNSTGISHFLDPIGMMEYEEIFKIKGFDIESDFQNLDEDDLNQMKIFNEAHRRQILEAAQTFETSENFRVFLWLRENGLDYYFDNFMNCDIDNLRAASNLEVNEKSLHDLEVHLPGHRKRLQSAVCKLRKRQKFDWRVPGNIRHRNIIAVGYWGRPPFEGCNYDFLFVQATLKSRHPEDPTFEEEFLVDSGSDVGTVKQELLDRLKLDFKGNIKSRGVHSTVDKQLYKAYLSFGQDTEIEIEVMSEKYNSIGIRTMHQFRHVIDNRSHVWLPADPSPSSDSDDDSGSESRIGPLGTSASQATAAAHVGSEEIHLPSTSASQAAGTAVESEGIHSPSTSLQTQQSTSDISKEEQAPSAQTNIPPKSSDKPKKKTGGTAS